MTEIINNFYPETDTEGTTPAVSTHEAFTPINDLLLLKRVVEDNSKKGSFVIPERYRQQSNRSSVIAVGEKVTNIKAGDIVFHGQYNSEIFEIDGDEHILVRIGDVRGVERLKAA